MMQQTFVRLLIMLGCAMFSSTGFANDDTAQVTYSKALQTQLTKALKNKGSDYQARTRHISNKQPIYTNRLILTDSPYLLQHAHNPVNWYPWGADAFAAAKGENKPIFLSIGYATCHWCHVMEKESFEDKEVAKILNKNYISIKVDREQYPHIDKYYQNIYSIMNQKGGGWPLTIILTSDLKPIFSATYIPKYAGYSSKGLLTILTKLKSIPTKQLNSFGTKIINIVNQNKTITKGKLNKNLEDKAVKEFQSYYDFENNGFSIYPKFPHATSVDILLDIYNINKNNLVLSMANNALISILYSLNNT